MAKAGVFIIVLVALVVVVVAFFLLQEQEKPALIIDVSGNNQQESVIVKQSSVAASLPAECADKNYISETADYIVEGVVENSEPRWRENAATGRHIITYVNFSIEKYVKGSPFGDKLQIEAVGGRVGDTWESVEDMPIFNQGKNLRIYFHKTENEFWIVCAQFGVEEYTTTEPPQPTQQTKEFTVRESNYKLNPSTMTVNEGDTVKITVINEGGTHNLFVEGYDERTDVVSSGNTKVLEFVADKAGTFNIWCEVGSHRSLGMEGTLIVQ